MLCVPQGAPICYPDFPRVLKISKVLKMPLILFGLGKKKKKSYILRKDQLLNAAGIMQYQVEMEKNF